MSAVRVVAGRSRPSTSRGRLAPAPIFLLRYAYYPRCNPVSKEEGMGTGKPLHPLEYFSTERLGQKKRI